MSLQHFFLDKQIIAEEFEHVFLLQLLSDDLKHARALRLTSEEHIAVIDASKNYYECAIDHFDKSGLWVRVAGRLIAHEYPCVSLVVGIPKAEKMGTIIRHCTELGVSNFIPVQFSRSITRISPDKALTKQLRWQSIAKSAAMQSGQARIPLVEAPLVPSDLYVLLQQYDVVCICWEQAEKEYGITHALASINNSDGHHDWRVAIIIGPEGGLSEHEVASLMNCNKNTHLVCLGSSILRCETASIVASALVMHELGNLGK